MASTDRPIDGCAEEPEIVLARAEHVVAEDGALPSPARLYVHALGLLHDVSEHLDRARPSLELARSSAEDPALEAAVLVALAELEGRQGRTAEALARADEAEALFGRHPAIDRARGRALSAVWRWEEASAAYARVTEDAPLDTEAWRDLARAWGSLGEDRPALSATARGLLLQPRDEGLLRTQALALEALGDPRASDARAAFLWCRRPDDETALRFSCDRDPLCAERRAPVPHF
jgi:predicted Zn-dependent protease